LLGIVLLVPEHVGTKTTKSRQTLGIKLDNWEV
jgi:hypothetical protein